VTGEADGGGGPHVEGSVAEVLPDGTMALHGGEEGADAAFEGERIAMAGLEGPPAVSLTDVP
jgi:hypothetical protein